MHELQNLVAQLEKELSYCCGTTANKCRIKEILEEIKKLI